MVQGQDYLKHLSFISQALPLVILGIIVWFCALPTEGTPSYYRLNDVTMDRRKTHNNEDNKILQEKGFDPGAFYERREHKPSNEFFSYEKRRQVKHTLKLQNKLGYYLIVTPNGDVRGTSDKNLAERQGIFIQEHGSGPDYVTLKNKSTQKYVAISNTGSVYSSTKKQDLFLYEDPYIPRDLFAYGSPSPLFGMRKTLALETDGDIATVADDPSYNSTLFRPERV